jgi:signal transduction histidine kinase
VTTPVTTPTPRPGALDPGQAALLVAPESGWAERHPRLVDWLLAGVYGALSALWIALLVPLTPPPLTWLFDLGKAGPRALQSVAVLANIVALLRWRRTRPWRFAGVVIITQAAVRILASPGGQTMWTDAVIIITVLFTLAVRVGPVAAAWLTGLLLAVEVWVTVGRGGQWGGSLAFVLVPELCGGLLALWAGHRARLRAAREHQAAALRADYERWAKQAVTQERSRIAREMNDIISHALAETVALADGAALVLDRQPERARSALAQIGARGRQSVADMRRMVGVLRAGEEGDEQAPPVPAAPDPGDPLPDLPWPNRWLVAHPLRTDLLIALADILAGAVILPYAMAQAHLPAAVAAALGPNAEAIVSWAGVALGLVALVLWRRRAPITFALAIFVIDLAGNLAAGALPVDLLVLVALYGLAHEVSDRTAWLGAGVYTAWACADRVVGGYRDGDPNLWSVVAASAAVTLLLAWAAITLGGLARRRAARLAADLDDAQAFQRAQGEKAQQAVAAEHHRIAREMHDVVSHSLTVMVALADGAEAALAKNPARAKQALDRIAETGRQSVADMRRMLGVLGDEPEGAGPADGADGLALRPQPGGGDLVQLVEDFRQAGLPVSLTLHGEVPADPALVLTAYRVVQEALTNVLRHAADPTRIDVTVSHGPAPAGGAALTIDVVNDGGTESVQRLLPSGGHGLVGLRERAAMFGGTADMGPVAGGGWQVHVMLPTHPPA